MLKVMNNSLIYLVLGLGCISAQIPAASSSANIRVPRQFPPFPDGSCQSCRPVPTFPTVNRLANFAPCSFWMGSNGADCWQCCQQKAFENQWGQLFLVSPSFDGTFNTCVCCTNSCDGGFPPTGGVVAAAPPRHPMGCGCGCGCVTKEDSTIRSTRNTFKPFLKRN